MKYLVSSIKRFFFAGMISLAFVVFVLWGAVWIYGEYRAFRTESHSLRAQYLHAQKELLHDEVAKLADYIRHMMSQSDTKLKASIEGRVTEAHQIATTLYLQHRESKSPDEIKKMIRDVLRLIRFNNGRGYFFAFDESGIAELCPDRPEMEGRHMLSGVQTREAEVVRDMIHLVRTCGEGFHEYEWMKPGGGEVFYPKIAFVKLFEPYGWGIGAGEYRDEVTSQIQEEVLGRAVAMRFGSEGYFFGSMLDGSPLFSNGQITKGSANIWDLTDPDGVKIIQEQRKAADRTDGGFVFYSWRKLESDHPVPKLSYVLWIPEWKWIIGSGVYLDTIESEIDRKKSDLRQNLIAKIQGSLWILLFAFLLTLLWGRHLSIRIKSSIDRFSSFFEEAVTQSSIIDPAAVHFDEFKHLASLANRMLAERIQSEESLRESEEKYRVLFHNELYAICIFDLDNLQFLDVNEALQSLYGYSRDELLGGMTIHDITVEHEESDRAAQQAAVAGTIYIPLRFHKKKDGTVFPVEIVGGPYSWQGKRVMFGVARDISERLAAEEALKEAHRRLDAIIEFFPDATFVIDADGKVTHWNKAIEAMTGVSKADMLQRGNHETGIPFYGNRRPILIDIAMSMASGQDLETKEYDLFRREGDRFLAEAFVPRVSENKGAYLSATASILRDRQGNMAGAIQSIRDITERKQAEEERFRLERQLQQAQKAESLARMAGAIAHHFNNMLAAVIGYLELAQEDTVRGTSIGLSIGEALKASQRAAEMSRLMLTYLGQTAGRAELVDLAEVGREALVLLDGSLPAHVRVSSELSLPGPIVRANRADISQVLNNLVSNALEVIGSDDGEITVAIGAVETSEVRAFRCFPLDWEPNAQSYACLSVADNGRGIDGATLDQIFDPFFSTKFLGRGLGLSVVLGLVRAFDGAVAVETRPGQGTTFRVFFPMQES